MQQEEFVIQVHKTQIYGRYIRPDGVKGVIVVVHGFGEHSGRYLDHVAPMLLETGLSVVLYDNIGHGKSGGKRGHCPSYEALLDILERVVQKAETLFIEMPLFLYGHSMGGNLVLNYALRKKIRLAGIIATSPYLRLAFEPPKWKMALGKMMLHVIPSVTMPSGLDPNGISRISEEVEKYKSDPFIHDKISPMFSFPIMEAGEWAILNADRLSVDTLLLHGTSDPIIDYRGTEDFHKKANTTKLKRFEKGYHELHNDLCRSEMLDEISGWIKRKLARHVQGG